MADIGVNGATNVGNSLQDILMSDTITPGAEPSYQLCKTIYIYHPMGAKIVEGPVKLAMSQPRKITVSKAPEELVRNQFLKVWKELECDKYIATTKYLSRIYGIASCGYLVEGKGANVPIDPFDLPKARIIFNTYDPLNTAGSLVLNQTPTDFDFQKNVRGLRISGEILHPSRSVTVMNETPIYIQYTPSAFGFVGRSVYQRALYPLKTFVQSMVTDDMVTRKAGLLIAKLKGAGSIVNKLMQAAAGIKRSILREGQTDQVLSIDILEEIETLNMQHTDTAMTTARKNVIENIATACGEPAKLLLQESFAEGFGEGTEDANHIIQRIKNLREELQPLYDYFDTICMYRAWTPEFFEIVKAQVGDEFKWPDFQSAFYEWKDSFKAEWPSLKEEPESELAKTDKVMLEGITDVLTALLSTMDPDNQARLIQWAQDNMNERKLLFPHSLDLDTEALKAFTEEKAAHQQEMDEAAMNDPGAEGGAPGLKKAA